MGRIVEKIITHLENLNPKLGISSGLPQTAKR